MRGIVLSVSLGSVRPGSGRDFSVPPYFLVHEDKLQCSLLCTAALVMHDIMSCTKGYVGMKNVGAAWFMQFYVFILKHAASINACKPCTVLTSARVRA